MHVTGKTRVCAVIGDPIEHSLSPCIHNAAFKHLGLDYIYVAFRVRRGMLRGAIEGMRSLGIHGLNVTMPHKIDVIQYLDRLDEYASMVRSVNTILNRDGLIGYNTDGVGALRSLRIHIKDLGDAKVIILGAGGASRSISFSIAQEAGELVILNRTVWKAKELAERISKATGKNVKWGGIDKIEDEIEDANIIINATSVGMHPRSSESPVSVDLLRKDLIVFDLVYNPLETKLLKEAKYVGAKTIDGLTMLVNQGAASFEIWTGEKAPFNIMMEAALKHLMKSRNEPGKVNFKV